MNVAADDEEDRPCSDGATCATGGSIHCRMVTKYPWLLEDVSPNECCVKGCFLDEKNGNADG